MDRVVCFRNETSRFGPYTDGDLLVRYDADATSYIETWTTDDAVLNRTWRVMNAVDGWEPICATRERSLSVGDVIEIQRRLMDGWLVARYAVDHVGFTDICSAAAETVARARGVAMSRPRGEPLIMGAA